MKHDTPAVRIASTRPGFWRCGRQHGTEPVVHPAGTFTEAEIERLLAEPALIVDVDPAPGSSGEAPAGIFVQALDALRAAEPAEVAGFLRQVGADKEIRAKMERYEGDRRDALLSAISGLEEGNEAHWTKSGKPEVRALEAAIGFGDISAAERDDAFEEFQKAKE